MDDSTRNRIRLATVTVINDEEAGSKGRGFVVPGSYIVTAAHCVPWSVEGLMALDDYFLVKIITADGIRLTGQVVAVEPVSDIAVIGSPDNQTFIEEAEAFDKFVASVKGLPLCSDEFASCQKVLVHILTHSGEWLSGHSSQWGDNAPTLYVETDPTIPAGTSGSAIVNDCGAVVGVVSNSSESEGTTAGCGTCARPCQSLPVWLWRAIKAAETEVADNSEQ
jgi:S1-C subfamily serine protease